MALTILDTDPRLNTFIEAQLQTVAKQEIKFTSSKKLQVLFPEANADSLAHLKKVIGGCELAPSITSDMISSSSGLMSGDSVRIATLALLKPKVGDANCHLENDVGSLRAYALQQSGALSGSMMNPISSNKGENQEVKVYVGDFFDHPSLPGNEIVVLVNGAVSMVLVHAEKPGTQYSIAFKLDGTFSVYINFCQVIK